MCFSQIHYIIMLVLLVKDAMSGDDGGEVTPVPMPNTAVKFPSADGS